jgi:hypothetical protein
MSSFSRFCNNDRNNVVFGHHARDIKPCAYAIAILLLLNHYLFAGQYDCWLVQPAFTATSPMAVMTQSVMLSVVCIWASIGGLSVRRFFR